SFLFVLLLALALDRQHIVVDLDLDVVLLETRQVGADDEIVAALKDFDLRRPRARALASAEYVAAEAEVLEQAIHLVVPALEHRRERGDARKSARLAPCEVARLRTVRARRCCRGRRGLT